MSVRLDECTWASNSRGENPCDVAYECEKVCNKWARPLLPLNASGNPEELYPPPDESTQNACLCSSVVYSLVSACTVCQGRIAVGWDVWSANCSLESLSTDSLPYYSDIEIPPWAYLLGDHPRPGAHYDPSLAEQNATAALSQESSTSTSASQSAIGSTSSSSNAGAIAGGVIGGVVFLASLTGLVFWFLRRRNQARTPPSAAYKGYAYSEAAVEPLRPDSVRGSWRESSRTFTPVPPLVEKSPYGPPLSIRHPYNPYQAPDVPPYDTTPTSPDIQVVPRGGYAN